MRPAASIRQRPGRQPEDFRRRPEPSRLRAVSPPGQAESRKATPARPGTRQGNNLQREQYRQKFSLYSWTGNTNNAPTKLIDDLRRYAIRPEGVDLIQVGNVWRILFVEDRFLATGYGTRNAIHWPLSIVGPVP